MSYPYFISWVAQKQPMVSCSNNGSGSGKGGGTRVSWRSLWRIASQNLGTMMKKQFRGLKPPCLAASEPPTSEPPTAGWPSRDARSVYNYNFSTIMQVQFAGPNSEKIHRSPCQRYRHKPSASVLQPIAPPPRGDVQFSVERSS